MTEIAKAYVQIVPTTKGITDSLQDELGGPLERQGNDSGSKFGAAFGKMAKKFIAAAAIAKVAGAAIDIGKESVKAYADYEQLTGGIKKLFGDAYNDVMANANQAFQTAGLSANEYMETVTSFSSSLIQSMGGDTAAAAQVADMALRDMSDNANTFGTDMESIQYAYQSFARGQYTLLDNLKIGYGGTREEMERLLADATALTGVHYDITNLNDVYSAIHAVQTEMGITGTTASEAAGTLSGSVDQMRGAWKNLLIGMSDPSQDPGQLASQFALSIQTVLSNLGPICLAAGKGMLIAFKTLGGMAISGLGNAILAGFGKLRSLGGQALTAVKNGIKSGLASIRSVGGNLITGLWNGINDKVKWIKDKITGFGKGVIKSIKSIFGVKSPSRVFAEIGGYLATGLGVGWDDRIDGVKNKIGQSLAFDVGNITGRVSTAYAANRYPSQTVDLKLNSRTVARAVATDVGGYMAWEVL